MHSITWQKAAGALQSFKIESPVVFHGIYMPIFYCLQDNDLVVENLFFLSFCPPQSCLKPSHRGSPGTYGMGVGLKKLESLGYLAVKTA